MLLLTLFTLLLVSTASIFTLFILPVYTVRKHSFQVLISTIRNKTPFGRGTVGDIYIWIIFLFLSPYSATIFPRIDQVDESRVIISSQHRFLLRNPFASMHAAALTNLGEMTCGLHVLNQLHRKALAIPTEIRVKFLKKARGRITAKCETEVPSSPPVVQGEEVQDKSTQSSESSSSAAASNRVVLTTQAVLSDESNQTVATVDVYWTVNYKQQQS